jgi:acetyl esterase/lipase
MNPLRRRDALALAAGGLTLAIPALARAGEPADVLARVDPQLRSAAAALIKAAEHPGPPFKLPDDWKLPAWVEQRSITGAADAPPVRTYLIVPPSPAAKPRPAILHIHGGGFVGGDPRMDLGNLHHLSEALDCVVVSVDYRLAPATRFPGSLEDNYAALLWLHGNAGSLGVDPARIAVMGESAGGGHAAMLAIAARDRGVVPLVAQILVYPMLDDRTGSARPAPPGIGTLVWTAQQNREGWTGLLGVPAGSRRVPPGSVPARETSLAGLPRTFIGVGSLDLFVDEDIDYARRLIDAGVPTDLLVVPGAFHGFQLIASQAAVSQRFKAAIQDALARAFAA